MFRIRYIKIQDTVICSLLCDSWILPICIINNVIPEEMLLRDRIELQSSQIPPSYDEVLPSNNRNVAVNSKNTNVSENSVRETEIFDEDALERVM